MKKADFIFIAAVIIFFLPFFVFTPVYEGFLWMTKNHPFLMSFFKFAILSTAGECIGLRIKSGSYAPKGFGIIPHAITWGVLGVVISCAMTIYQNGVPVILTMLNITPQDTTYAQLLGSSILSTKSWYHFGAALGISVMMNTLFAPVFMIAHKISDAQIMRTNGTLKGYFSAWPIKDLFVNLDWGTMWSFLIKRTIPLFWYPAHTITFMLAPEYRVLFAALLGVMLGVFMSLATKKK